MELFGTFARLPTRAASRVRLARFRRLRWKLTLTFILLAIPPLALAVVYVFAATPARLEDEAVADLRTRQQVGADLMEQALSGVREEVAMFSRFPALVELASGGDTTEALKSVEEHFVIAVEEHGSYLQLRFLDRGGREVVRVNREREGVRAVEPFELQDKSQRYYFTDAMSIPVGLTRVSSIDLNREHGEIQRPYVAVVRFASAVASETGEPAGVVVINVGVDRVLDSLRALSDPRGALALVDREGYFILHPIAERSWSGPSDLDTGWNLFDEAPELRAIWGSETVSSGSAAGLHEVRASDLHIVAGPVDPGVLSGGWILAAWAPRSTMLAPAKRLRELLLGIFLAMAVAGAAVIWLAAGMLSRPAQALREGAARVGDGDFEHRIDLRTADELSDVAEAFNLMSERLRESYEGLERRVSERTRDLEDRDEKLRTLGEMGRALVGEHTPGAVCRQATLYARRLVGAGHVALVAYDGEGRVAEKATSCCDPPCGREHAPDMHPGASRLDVSLVARGGSAIGTLSLLPPLERTSFSEAERDIVEALAGHVAVALENARLHDRELATVSKLEELNQAKSDFVSTVSHQLRSPVSAIKGYGEILAKHESDLKDDERARILREISTQAAQLNELVEDVLQVSRIDSGRLDVLPKPALLGPIVEEAAHDAEPLTEPRRVRLHRPEHAPVVSADPALLKQAFTNVIENALKYSPPESLVDIAWRRGGREDHALITVDDRGPGIHGRDRERVFERFVRLPSSAGEIQGTGLGLYITRSIIQAHDGSIHVEQRADGGASIVMQLPIRRESRDGTD